MAPKENYLPKCCAYRESIRNATDLCDGVGFSLQLVFMVYSRIARHGRDYSHPQPHTLKTHIHSHMLYKINIYVQLCMSPTAIKLFSQLVLLFVVGRVKCIFLVCCLWRPLSSKLVVCAHTLCSS